jgi:hypothetical protein
MTPREFILHWHRVAKLAAPRLIPNGWECQAMLLMERGITGEDLTLVAKWMLTQLARSQGGERNSVAFNAASFRWGKMFGEYGSEEPGNEFARFAELLSAAEAARPRAVTPPKPPRTASAPRVSDAEWEAAAARVRAVREALGCNPEGRR